MNVKRIREFTAQIFVILFASVKLHSFFHLAYTFSHSLCLFSLRVFFAHLLYSRLSFFLAHSTLSSSQRYFRVQIFHFHFNLISAREMKMRMKKQRSVKFSISGRMLKLTANTHTKTHITDFRNDDEFF